MAQTGVTSGKSRVGGMVNLENMLNICLTHPFLSLFLDSSLGHRLRLASIPHGKGRRLPTRSGPRQSCSRVWVNLLSRIQETALSDFRLRTFLIGEVAPMKRQFRTRLKVESLEERCVPANYTLSGS